MSEEIDVTSLKEEIKRVVGEMNNVQLFAFAQNIEPMLKIWLQDKGAYICNYPGCTKFIIVLNEAIQCSSCECMFHTYHPDLEKCLCCNEVFT